MVYDLENHCEAPDLTLLAVRSYIWSLTPADAKFLCWHTVFAESENEKVLDWINSLEPEPHLDALRACHLVFSVSDSRVVPRRFQLTAALAAYGQKHAIVNAGTGSGKTFLMVIPLLMNPEVTAVVIFPLKW